MGNMKNNRGVKHKDDKWAWLVIAGVIIIYAQFLTSFSH
jgi:hypothetical protein